jgi:zinc transport system permease protein
MPETLLAPLYALVDRLLPFPFAEPVFMKRAVLAALFVSPAAAAVGVPLVQFRMAFFSDAIGHSAFTGVALGVLLGIHPLLAMVALGLLIAVAFTLVKGRTGLPPDTLTGVFFSTAVALGIALISARKGLARDLPSYLYGDLLAISDAEILWMAALLIGVILYLFFVSNRILLLGVHEGFARSLGVAGRTVEISFAIVAALVVTTAIRAVGILLVTALLVVPAATARNLAKGVSSGFWLAIGIAVASSVGGLAASYHLDTATGATIVLFTSAFFALSVVCRRFRGAP